MIHNCPSRRGRKKKKRRAEKYEPKDTDMAFINVIRIDSEWFERIGQKDTDDKQIICPILRVRENKNKKRGEEPRTG